MFSSSVHNHELWQNSHQTSSLDEHNICKRFLKMLTINPLVWPKKIRNKFHFFYKLAALTILILVSKIGLTIPLL